MKLNITALDSTMKKSLSSIATKHSLQNSLQSIKAAQSNSIDPNNEAWITAILNTNKKINEIESNKYLEMYLVESAEIVDAYKNILNKPIKMSFMGPVATSSHKKEDLQQKYLDVYNKYSTFTPDLDIATPTGPAVARKQKCTIDGCDGTVFTQVNETSVCDTCSCVQNTAVSTTSYADIDRINVTTRYLYDRKVHFRDCILQFQGRQNVTIDKSVYDQLEREFGKHHLLIGDKNTPNNIRFSKVSKEHISMFLKELRLAKHYENVQLIHFNLSGKPPPDISMLEGILLSDFEQLTALYDDIYRNETRKNFINTQFTLFQLLKRHKYPCDVSDFSIIKTSERRDWHNRVCKDLFGKLNWNFTAV